MMARDRDLVAVGDQQTVATTEMALRASFRSNPVVIRSTNAQFGLLVAAQPYGGGYVYPTTDATSQTNLKLPEVPPQPLPLSSV